MFLTLYLCLVPNHFINQIIATPSLIHPYPSVPRIGQIVILHVGDSAACALVHTVWPVGRKSRPCVQKVLLERVKVFRATILQRTAREGQLVPTEDTWLHRPEHVLAILDVASQDFHAGFFTLTEASMEAFECLLTSEVGVRDDEKTKARKARSSKVSFKNIAKRLHQAATTRSRKGERDANSISPDDIRRSVTGKNAIKKLVVKAIELDTLHFAETPLFDTVSQKCTIKKLGNYLFKDFVNHVGPYFQFFYFKIRSPAAYGQKVFDDLKRILEELGGETPQRSKLQKLIVDVRSAKLEGGIEV